jgi:hypothetical protein
LKRYVVTLEKYVFAENDKEAIYQAQKQAVKEQIAEDNRCSVTEIVEQPFGTIGNRKVL